MILKLIKDLVSKFKRINYCKKCGRNVETFRMIGNALWVEIVDHPTRDYCIRCFYRIGHKKGYRFTVTGKMVGVFHE